MCNKIFTFLIFLIISFSFSGCLTSSNEKLNKKKKEAVSQGVYATNDAINYKRYDLASKYSNETVKIVEPPKNRVKIYPISIRKVDPETGLEIRENVSILPDDTSTVVKLNSKEYQKLIETLKGYEIGHNEWVKYSIKIEDIRKLEAKEKERLVQKVEELKKEKIGIFAILKYGFLLILSIPALILLFIIIWLSKIIIKVIKN